MQQGPDVVLRGQTKWDTSAHKQANTQTHEINKILGKPANLLHKRGDNADGVHVRRLVVV